MYIIGDKVVFSSDDGEIWNIEDENEKVSLTPSVSRLLILLLEKRGTVVTRDEIFQQVWDHWGKEGSNNSLNNYISQLRKLFSHYGINPDFIETVPRIGFLLKGDEVNVRDDGYLSAENNTAIKSNKPIQTPWLYILFVVFSTISGVMFYKAIKYQSGDMTPVYLSSVDKCDIYDLSDADDVNVELKKDIASKIIDNKNINCSQNTIIFFQADKLMYSNLNGRFYMAACNGTYQRFNMCVNYVDTDTKVTQ